MSTDQQTVQDLPIVPESPEDAPENALVARSDPAEDTLEKRLAWLTNEVRAASAEQAKKKRSESVLEARDYKVATVPIAAPAPKDLDLPKVALAPNIKPSDEKPMVERHGPDATWQFDVSDPAEVSRTMPLDPRAPIADPLPFRSPARGSRPKSSNWFVTTIAVLCGMLIGAVIHRVLPAHLMETNGRIATAHGGARIMAFRALERYEDWLTIRALAAQLEHSKAEPREPVSQPEVVPRVTPRSSQYFPYLTAPRKNPVILPRKASQAPSNRRVVHE